MASHTAAAYQPALDPLERETIRRVSWRLLPLLMLGYFCAYLDRVNVGFAGLTMNKSLGFSAAVFGFGSGVFFVGYFLFEIPSNLILARVGTAAAGGIALINAVGNLGGFLGPYMFGLVKDSTGSDTIGLLAIATAPVVSAIVLLSLGHDKRLERIPPRAAAAE